MDGKDKKARGKTPENTDVVYRIVPAQEGYLLNIVNYERAPREITLTETAGKYLITTEDTPFEFELKPLGTPLSALHSERKISQIHSHKRLGRNSILLRRLSVSILAIDKQKDTVTQGSLHRSYKEKLPSTGTSAARE